MNLLPIVRQPHFRWSEKYNKTFIVYPDGGRTWENGIELRNMDEYNAHRWKHSWPMSVDVPRDVLFAEWILSDNFDRSQFAREAKAANIPLDQYVMMKYREYSNERVGST